MKKSIYYILLFGTSLGLFSQEMTTLFNNTYFIIDSLPYAFTSVEVQYTNTYITGSRGDNGSFEVLIKLGENGEILQETYLDTVETYFLHKPLIKTNDSNFVYAYPIIGTNTDVDTDIRVIKVSPTGTIIWKKTYSSSQIETVRDIVQASDGGYLIAGVYRAFDNPPPNHFAQQYLLKIDTIGNIEWEKTFAWNNANAQLRSVVNTSDGGYLIGGGISYAQESIMTYTKIDSLGNVEWLEEVDAVDCFINISKLPDGGYLLNSCTILESVFLRKLDENFDVVWDKNVELPFDGQYSFYNTPLIKSNGGFLVTSSFTNIYGRNQPGILDFDSAGNINWAKTYTVDSTENCFLRDFAQNQDGTYTLVGAQFSGFQKGWVLKIDSLGNSCEIPNCDTTSLTACLYIPEGELCCAAVETEVLLDYILVTDSLNINCFDLSENLYAEYENGGTILWDFGDGNTSTESSPVHIYEEANFYNVTLSVILCGDTTSVFETVKVGEPVGIEAINNNQAKVYPNPATTSITFEYDIEQEEILFLYNSLGQQVKESELDPSSNTQTISTESFMEGIYYWQLANQTGKLIISR